MWAKDSKFNPVAWDKICCSKEKGGLGIRKNAHFNNACLAKLVWKVLTEDNNLWVQIVKNKYLKNEEFLNNKIRQNYSCAWKGILKARVVVIMGLRWVVGNGEDICFWTHN